VGRAEAPEAGSILGEEPAECSPLVRYLPSTINLAARQLLQPSKQPNSKPVRTATSGFKKPSQKLVDHQEDAEGEQTVAQDADDGVAEGANDKDDEDDEEGWGFFEGDGISKGECGISPEGADLDWEEDEGEDGCAGDEVDEIVSLGSDEEPSKEAEPRLDPSHEDEVTNDFSWSDEDQVEGSEMDGSESDGWEPFD